VRPEGTSRLIRVLGKYSESTTALVLFTQHLRRCADAVAQPRPAQAQLRPSPTMIVDGVLRTLGKVPVHPQRRQREPAAQLRYIEALSRKAVKELLPLHADDVPDPEPDVSALVVAFGCRPVAGVEEGVGRYVDWHRKYFHA
jgi:hypothetical protein